ncbi:MAG: DUF1045 domain-containing protein [Promethearchaeota archaeon]
MSDQNQNMHGGHPQTLKIFISWSGKVSHKVALAFREWIPDLVPKTTSFVSSEDISKGDNWFSILSETLDTTDFGILCITKEDMRTAWISFELGWLKSKGIPVSPFLFDLESEEIKGTPEEYFQITYFRKDEIRKLVDGIVKAYNSKYKPKIYLDPADFDLKWPDLETKLLKIRKEHPRVSYSVGIQKNIFPASDSTEFKHVVENIVKEAQKIIMIGTGLNILFSDDFRVDLLSRASNGECELEIYLADPESPNIHVRLIEEELGKIKPPVGYENLLKRLESMLDTINHLNNQSKIKLNLFSNYPTFALIIVDNEYFLYPYGYATLGNFSPVVYFSQSNPNHKYFIKYLDEQYELIKKYSIDAATIFSSRRYSEDIDIETLHPFALFYVPPKNSQLYKFGTQVLGYDIYERILVDSAFKEYVGDASTYGFHLTLCDVLYFLSETEIEAVKKELKFLAKSFREFNLTGLQITKNFPDSTSMAITIEDPSGNLEILHNEIVLRVYRRAIASNYTLGLANLNRNQQSSRERTDSMIKRYKAPYILQQFKPHFTLLTDVQSERQDEVYAGLIDLFDSLKTDNCIKIENLAIMSFNKKEKKWIIKDRIPLR